MAVQRVSPAPNPPPGCSVKDGYLWTMDDPPHSTVVVHHDEVRHVFAKVAGTWKVLDHYTSGVHYIEESGTFEFDEEDLGEGWTVPSSVARFSGPGGASVSFLPSTGGWLVTLPSVVPSDPWMEPFDLSFTDPSSAMAVGSPSSGSGSHGNLAATVSVSLRDAVVEPGWDEVVEPAWDEESPPPARTISYLGDY